MITKNTKDEAYYWSSYHKEKQMKKLISNSGKYKEDLGGFS